MYPANILLPDALAAWESPRFEAALRHEVEQLDPAQLPLQQALTASSAVANEPLQATVLNVSETADVIEARVGIFYRGVIGGCNCADDPTPVDSQPEYCVVTITIDKRSAVASVRWVPDLPDS